MTNKLYENPKSSAYLLIIISAILATIYNAFLPLHGDEAYYWMWSHDLQGGYYDHAPMIAYMIYLTNFVSESEWGVRLVNVFSLSIAALYIFKLTAKISDEKTGLNAILIFMSVIVVHAGYIIATPDSPLLLFWTLTLYYAYLALFEPKVKYFALTGLFLGLTMMSKYSAILLVASLLIYVILKRRDLFINPRFYLTVAIALLGVSPLLYWNYEHEWISFLFQIDHGSTGDFKINIGDALGFLAGQFILFSPVFTWVLFYYMFKERLSYRNDKIFFILLTSFVTLAFFAYKGLYKSMGLNYGAPAYVGGVIFVAYIISKYELNKTLKVGLAIAIVLSLIGRTAMLFFLDKVQERMYASDKIVERFATHIKEGDSLYGDHLTIAAYIKYYLPNHPDTDVAIDSRYSHYDMTREVWHKDGLVLSRESNREEALRKYYENVKLIDTHELIPGVRVFRTYRVSNPKKVAKK
ncbi:MAG: glycosyltransferase family 39 protein [Campylobacterota bacterium]|nr:glycosyltransferase family 39 protein [Campylobacterota bacterium]